MHRPTALSLALFTAACGTPRAQLEAEARTTLDAFHSAAAVADEAAYFGAFTADAVFIGTDDAERWTLPEFESFAAPYFERESAWEYVASSRNVMLSPDGDVAWFDERLDNEKYGRVRGSGVLVREKDAWRVAHYVLSFPVPNELALDLVESIRTNVGP